MAGDDLSIKGFVEFLLRGKGLKDAQQGLDKTKDKAHEATRSFAGMERGAEALGRKLQAVLGAAAIGALVKASVSEFASYERGLNAIGKQLQSMGQQQDGAIPRVREFLQTLESGTGVLRQEALPTFQKFLGITKSLPGAMYATKLAADLTNAGLGDMRTNGERLANLLQGEVTEAAKSLGLQLRDENGVVKTQTQLLDELIGLYGGFSAQQKDAQSQIEKAIAGWNEFKQVLGKSLAPALNVVGSVMTNVVRVTQSLGPIIVKTFYEAAGEVLAFGKQAAAALNLKRLITEGPAAYAAAIAAAGAEGRARYTAEIEGAEEELVSIWTDVGVQSGEAEAEGREAVTKVAQAKAMATAKQQADQRLAFERKTQADLLQARIDATREGSKEQYDLQVQLLEAQRQASLTAARKLGADVAAINELFDVQVAKLREDRTRRSAERELQSRSDLIDAYLELEQAYADDTLAVQSEKAARQLELVELQLQMQRDLELLNEELTDEERARIRAKYEKKTEKAVKDSERAQLDIRRRARLQDIGLQQQWAATTFTILQTVFGENKALAIAETLFQTFKGAQKALAENPPPSPIGIASAAFVTAAGLKRANDIRKTNPGFDDPAHDRLARVGGRRWAEDLVRNLDMGFTEGLAGAFPQLARAGSQTINNVSEDRSMHVHFASSPLGGRASARRIARILFRAHARDSARALA